MIGQRVNNFEIVRLIGEGGMGTVYEAQHRLIRRKVAIKVLRHEFTRDLDLVRRFFNEARATSEIRHPNIIEIVDVGTLADGVPYLVMELLEGESLAERLASAGRLDPPHIAYWASQAADALHATHANAIIHRDLKPDNLFLVRGEDRAQVENVKVLDFGIAKLRGDPSGSSVRTSPGAVLGTPAYMSPEQCRGNPEEIGPATDVYSLGVILYEMLCGEPPFVAVGLGEVLMMHMSVMPLLPSKRVPDVPADLEAVIMRAVEKQPQARFASMADLASALRATDAFARAAASPNALARPPSSASALVAQRLSSPMGAAANAPTLIASDSGASTPSGVTVTGELASLKPRNKRSGRALVLAGVLAVSALLGGVLLYTNGEPARGHGVQRLETGLAKHSPNLESIQRKAHSDAASVKPAQQAVAVRTDLSRAARSPAIPANHARTRSAETDEAVSANSANEPASGPDTPAVKPASGYLSLDSSPWAIVSMAGRSLGTTPLVKVALPPGHYVLKLENPEIGRSTSYTVEIQPGRNTSRFVGWGSE